MYSQEIEIIEQISAFHKHLNEFYDSLKEKTKDPKAKLLLDYLSHHEKLREDYLIKYEKYAPKKEMKNWIKGPPMNLSNSISECSKKINVLPSYSVDDIVKIALHFDDCLYTLYEKLAIEEKTKRSHTNVFFYMMRRTKQHEKNLSRDVNWLYDL
jgi:rubrerythrin